jgi:prepilin-type N-terminal cleavage/methylation domain-containing protein
MKPLGFAMTEVLVALAVTAVGLGAALGLALAGYATAAEARRAEIASALAADLAGRVRALAAVDWLALPDPLECGSECTAEQLAALELAGWRATVQAALPTGSARLDAGEENRLAITLGWTETGNVPRELRLEIAR